MLIISHFLNGLILISDQVMEIISQLMPVLLQCKTDMLILILLNYIISLADIFLSAVHVREIFLQIFRESGLMDCIRHGVLIII